MRIHRTIETNRMVRCIYNHLSPFCGMTVLPPEVASLSANRTFWCAQLDVEAKGRYLGVIHRVITAQRWRLVIEADAWQAVSRRALSSFPERAGSS